MNRAIPVAVAVALVATGGFFLNRNMRGKGPAGATQYKLTKAEMGEVKKTVSATGTLQPWTVVDIKSKAGGRVEQMPVEVGDEVRRGQVLARIDPSDTQLAVSTAQADIDAARARVSQGDYQYRLQVQQSKNAIDTARAQKQSAEANLRSAESRLRTAQTQAKAQPTQTRAAIRQAEQNHKTLVTQRRQLDATQAQALAQARAALNQAKANNKNAQENLNRQRSLLSKGFVSQAAVDQAEASAGVTEAQVSSAQETVNTIAAEQQAAREAAEARVAQALAQVQSARAQTDVQDRQNAVAEARAAVLQARASVTSAEANLQQAIANQANNQIRRYDIASAQAGSARARATMENAQTTLNQTVVRAPSEGIILKKYVEPGTIITSGMSLSSTGTSILQLGDVSKMYVNVTVDETDIASVDVGQKVDVTIEAYPGVPFEGKVARVDPQAQVEQNVTTVPVRVEIDNSSPTFRLLKPGMNATCEFVVDEKENVVSVPNEAVRTDDEGSYVEVGTGGKPAPPDPKTGTPAEADALVVVKIEKRRVEVGVEGNETVEIVSGLKEGDPVVTQTIEPEAPTAGGAMGGFGGRPGGGGGGRR